MAKELKALGLPGVTYIPVYFKPEFSKFKDDVCKGIQVFPEDLLQFRSFAVFYEIIRWVFKQYPQEFKWKQPPYEFEHKRLPIDMINGSAIIRESIEKDRSFSEIQPKIDQDLQNYRETVVEHLLY